MNKLRALIFDVDGTLADTERDGHRVAFNCAFAKAGLDWEWSAALYGELLKVSGGKERIRFYVDEYHPNFKPPNELEAFIADLHQAKSQDYQRLLANEGISLRPGVKRLLQEARSQGIRLAIATTAALANVTPLLQHSLNADALSWFEIIAAGDIVAAKKPAPDIYRYVLQKMNLSASECLAIEDSQHGLAAACQAGLKTVVTVNNYTQNQDFSDAVLVLNHLGEPNTPFQVLAGNAKNKSYLDIPLINDLVENL